MKKELHRLKLDIEKFDSKKQKIIQFRDGRYHGKNTHSIDDVEGVFDDIIKEQEENKPISLLKVEIQQLTEDRESLSN